MKKTRWMAATAVAALLGLGACSAAPRTVSIRSAGDSTPLAADPAPATTVDPTATTVEQPTVTTAPTATTDPTATTQPTSSTTAAVTPTTAPVTASTVQPVTATTVAAPVTATTVAMTPIGPMTTAPVRAAVPAVPGLTLDSTSPALAAIVGTAIDSYQISDTYVLHGWAVPSPLIVANGKPVAVTGQDIEAAQQRVDTFIATVNGGRDVTVTFRTTADPGSSLLGQVVRDQLGALKHVTVNVAPAA